MRPLELSRRGLLETVGVTAVGLSGCGSRRRESPSPADDGAATVGSTTSEGSVGVASLSVLEFVLYPLAGVHPHVHRRANTQYVTVRLDSPFSVETLRDRITLEVDERPSSLAERQPVPWQRDTTDLAFALRKDGSFESGRVLSGSTELDTLSDSTLGRLNTPPVFEVSEPSVSPNDLQAGARTEAAVTVGLTNTGDGGGEFGASLEGNDSSGADTLTATLAAGAERELTGVTTVVGEGDTATVSLDWGVDEWTTGIPVAGSPVGSDTPTATPAPR